MNYVNRLSNTNLSYKYYGNNGDNTSNIGMSKSYVDPEPSLSKKVEDNLSKLTNFSNPAIYMKNVREEINKIKNRNNIDHTTVNIENTIPKSAPKTASKSYDRIIPKSSSISNILNNNDSLNSDDNKKIRVVKKESNKNLNNNNIDSNNNINNTSIMASATIETNNNDKADKVNKYEFINLSYEDIQVNLRLLSDLKEGEKLMIKDNRYIVVDDRFGSSLWRIFSDDSRIRSLDFISHVIEESGRYCSDAVKKIKMKTERKANMEKLIHIQSLLTSSQTGLSRLIETYSDDKLSRAKIETIIKTINTYKDQDLKNAIE